MKGKKVLIVEDKILIARDISIILEKEGYNTKIGVTYVQEAIDLLELEKFDLVLIDINLDRNTDGVDIGRYLLKKDKIPYIYITSYSDSITLERLNETRPHGILIKPYKSIDIVSTVSIVMNNFSHKNIDTKRLETNTIDEYPYMLKNVIDFINSHLHDKIELHQLSSITKWSHQHFIKIFTKYIGKTPYQYILQRKIEKSKALLIETDQNLNEIAQDVGFESYSNFFIAFKKETGYGPDFYRRLKKIDRNYN